MRRSIAMFGLIACSAMWAGAIPALAATEITGMVTDRTTGKPSPGDTVALISFGKGMQVAAETKTDARGKYSIAAPDGETHLIRVDHQKATYFQPAPAGAHAVDVDVYDVAPTVKGIATEADVLSLQTAPSGELEVTEDYFVKNSSQPARTQFSDHAYEFFLPPGAKVQGTAAMGPGGMPVESTPVPLAGQGHYAFVFPVRPGESRFQVSYTLPYANKQLDWTQRESLGTENLVVLLPKSMQFRPSGTDWQPVPANPDAQTFVRKGVAADEPVQFAIVGEGQLPREAQASGGNNAAGGNTPGVATSGSMAADTRPGGGLGPPVDTPDPLNAYKGWLLGGLGLLLLAGAIWLWRGRPAGALETGQVSAREPEEFADATAAEDPVSGAASREFTGRGSASQGSANSRRIGLRPLLEQALLALEREHALGTLPLDEYGESRLALQKALHRALAREEAQSNEAGQAV
jgi:hypothetical protein